MKETSLTAEQLWALEQLLKDYKDAYQTVRGFRSSMPRAVAVLLIHAGWRKTEGH